MERWKLGTVTWGSAVGSWRRSGDSSDSSSRNGAGQGAGNGQGEEGAGDGECGRWFVGGGRLEFGHS